jgi:uncharacterized low-complexity protein
VKAGAPAKAIVQKSAANTKNWRWAETTQCGVGTGAERKTGEGRCGSIDRLHPCLPDDYSTTVVP